MTELNEREKAVLSKDFKKLNQEELDIFVEIEKRIEKEESCDRCYGNLIGCAFGIFICQDCGCYFNMHDFIKD